MQLDDQWVETALSITGNFETSGDPFLQVTGNFDLQGISCGVLQWNIKQGSLQPLLKRAGEALIKQTMPNYGEDLWNAATSSINAGMAIVTSSKWQAGNSVRPAVKSELQLLLGTEVMRSIQRDAARNKVGTTAFSLAVEWAKDLRNQDPTLREFCFFFDIVTQSGGMKGVWLQDVEEFKKLHDDGEKADDAICNWLEGASSNTHGSKDSKKNAALWRNQVPAQYLELFILGYLRALKSTLEWRIVAMNRRGTIAFGSGWVNGEKEDLTSKI
ncbi:MAG: hypothetical protein JNN15_08520 [Blastocatellia bacterium]|nr:hypothetical protein [Blastocatellia bacterium]